jgi:CheY-like chemotaxis protein
VLDTAQAGSRCVPAKPPPNRKRSAGAAAKENSVITKKRILIIDDDQLSRDGVAEVLTDEGYEVAVAADGQEAITLLPSFQPDLVLTDLQMPRLNGIDILNHVRNVSPSIPVIIFTADITLDAKRKAERLGVQDYVNKPLDFADLLVRVARAYSRGLRVTIIRCPLLHQAEPAATSR